MQHAKIKSITKQPFDGLVYNFQIDEDESYIANGLVVHNCIRVAIMDDEDDKPDFTGLPDAPGGTSAPSLSHTSPYGQFLTKQTEVLWLHKR